MKVINKELYPLLWLHLQALSKGCNQSFDDILILNFLPELDPLKNLYNNFIQPSHPDVRGCSDIHESTGWGHSEDGGNTTELGYVVDMTWINDNAQITSAVGFCYPGCLPGILYS